MPADLKAVMKLEVPLIVLLGERQMTMEEVRALAPGAIIEVAKAVDDELNVLVNNRPIGSGFAVKIGENFGIRVTYVGDLKDRIKAMGPRPAAGDVAESAELTLADALLS